MLYYSLIANQMLNWWIFSGETFIYKITDALTSSISMSEKLNASIKKHSDPTQLMNRTHKNTPKMSNISSAKIEKKSQSARLQKKNEKKPFTYIFWWDATVRHTSSSSSLSRFAASATLISPTVCLSYGHWRRIHDRPSNIFSYTICTFASNFI